jgi:signal transduction histidine kinase
MSHEVRQRIVRPATAEEKERHKKIREQIEQELPELQQWARDVADRHRDSVPVGTVLTSDEASIVQAIDEYANKHSLPTRSAVVREALANLLGLDIVRR